MIYVRRHNDGTFANIVRRGPSGDETRGSCGAKGSNVPLRHPLLSHPLFRGRSRPGPVDPRSGAALNVAVLRPGSTADHQARR